MKVNAVRSDVVYARMVEASLKKKNDIYRYELMMPFEKKWACYYVPMKATTENGYDVIMASAMLGYLMPSKVDESQNQNIEKLSSEQLWEDCQTAIEDSLRCFSKCDIELIVKNYLFTLVLAEADNPYIRLSDGYSGDGGIPGFITAILIPTEATISRLPALLAHEANHNVRFQFIEWRNDITLGEMIVSEGLAECFVEHLYGNDMVGPWVKKTDSKMFEAYIKPVIYEGLNVKGLDNISSYLYGDEIAELQGYEPVGLPWCAGYTCGYYLIRYYLEKTDMSIVEATILPAAEILAAVEDFWVD